MTEGGYPKLLQIAPGRKICVTGKMRDGAIIIYKVASAVPGDSWIAYSDGAYGPICGDAATAAVRAHNVSHARKRMDNTPMPLTFAFCRWVDRHVNSR